MKKVLVFAALIALASFGFAGVAKADTVTAGGVSYTFTNGGPDGSGGFFVTMTITGTPTASGSLTLFANQFFNATDKATNAVIVSGPAGWTVLGPGNVNNCGTGNLPFICSSGPAITITSGQDLGTITFLFDVTIASQPTTADIQAGQGQGALAISTNVPIGGPPTSSPEPASMLLLGLGLAGAPFLRRRRS